MARFLGFLLWRLPVWLVVQIYRLIGSVVTQALRLVLLIMSVLSWRLVFIAGVCIYGILAFRLLQNTPAQPWLYYSLINYSPYEEISQFRLGLDVLLLRETLYQPHREAQLHLAGGLLLLLSLIRWSRPVHVNLRYQLRSYAMHLAMLQPPRLIAPRAATPARPAMRKAAASPPPPSKQARTTKPAAKQLTKQRQDFYVSYGLNDRAENEALADIACALSPELQAFIGIAQPHTEELKQEQLSEEAPQATTATPPAPKQAESGETGQ